MMRFLPQGDGKLLAGAIRPCEKNDRQLSGNYFCSSGTAIYGKQYRRLTQEVIVWLSVDGSSRSAGQTDFNNVNLIIEKDPAACA